MSANASKQRARRQMRHFGFQGQYCFGGLNNCIIIQYFLQTDSNLLKNGTEIVRLQINQVKGETINRYTYSLKNSNNYRSKNFRLNWSWAQAQK
jgi:hypothetical protein